MTANQIAGILLIAGSTVFGVGAAVGVWSSPSPTPPRACGYSRSTSRLAQRFYALGPIVAAVGVGCLAYGAPAGGMRAVLCVATSALLLSALPWV